MRPDTKRVLDACCGSRMFWFDKTDARALFLDRRQEVCEDPQGRDIVINPDTLGDFTALPFDDETFSLVVFDPPHTFSGAQSVMAKKYGTLKAGWRDEIRAGFAECFRVLKPDGVLVFKWNEHRVPVATVLSLTPEKPLFGQRAGARAKTHRLVFMKPRGSAPDAR
jgi:ubiquinone/menaquinone biosynthesis C-methylase UbiE